MEKIFHANGNQKKAGVATLLSDKIDFKPESNNRQRRSLYNEKGVIPRQYNICKYIPNMGAPNYI